MQEFGYLNRFTCNTRVRLWINMSNLINVSQALDLYKLLKLAFSTILM